MMVLKLSIMASRAVDSQHTLVTVPVTRTVSRPRAQSGGQARGALDEGAEAVLLHDRILLPHIEPAPELMPQAVGGQHLAALGHALRGRHLQLSRPPSQPPFP